MTFELVKVNMCYLRAPLSWLTEQKNPKFLRSFQNAQRDTTHFAVNEHVRTYLCELCLLTSNDCRNDEHSEVTEGKTCEGVCIIWEKSINIMKSVFTFRTRPSKVWCDSGKAGFSPPHSRRQQEAMLRQGASITAFLLLLLLLPLLSSPFLIFSREDVRDTSRGQNIGVLSWPP